MNKTKEKRLLGIFFIAIAIIVAGGLFLNNNKKISFHNEVNNQAKNDASSSDSTLKSVSVVDNNGRSYNISPDFNKAITEYDIFIMSTAESVTITATPTASGATLTANGQKTSTFDDSYITFSVFEVTSPDGSSQTTYKFKMHKSKSAATDSSADMYYLAFGPGTGGSNITIRGDDYFGDKVDFTYDVPDWSGHTINYTYEYDRSGALGDSFYFDHDLTEYTWTHRIISPDGTKRKNYTVKFVSKSTYAYLRSLTLSTGVLNPNFSGSTQNYTASIPKDADRVEITYKLPDERVYTDYVTNIGLGETKRWTKITRSEYGNTLEYNIDVTRVDDVDVHLTSLSVDNYKLYPTFDPNITEYDIDTTSSTSLKVIATANDPSFTINGRTATTYTEYLRPNSNTGLITLVVKAPDGLNQKTYTIKVNKADYSNMRNSYLRDLSVAGATITPSFEKEVTDYSVSVPYETQQVTVTYVVDSTGRESSEVVLLNGTTTNWSIEILAPYDSSNNNYKTTYNLTITKSASANANLKSLSISGVSLNETFNKDVLNYTANVGENVSSVDITYVKEFDNSSATETKTLEYGTNTWTKTITAQDGTTKKTYKITITRALSSNANLKSLSISSGSLTFNKDTLTYKVNIGENVSSVDITYVKDFDNTSTTVTKTLSPGKNTWSITITAPNGTTKKTYEIEFNRALSSNADLRTLSVTGHTISPSFSKDVIAYTLSVANNVNQVTINYTIDATGTSSSDAVLINSETTIWNYTVTAPNGTTKKTYKITITRAKSSNASLKSLTLSTGSLNETFNKDVLNYTATVGENISSVDITYVKEFDNSSATETKTLEYGSNTWSKTITAEDGTTKKTYKITITRTQSSNAYLKSLSVSTGSLNKTFNKDTLNYTVTVGENVSSINITYVKDFDNTSKTETKTLNYGSNTWSTTVTAPNGTTTKTYTITITRTQSSNAYLKSLSVSTGTLDKPFDKDTLNYTVTVASGVTSVDITYVKDFDNTSKTEVKALNTGSNTWSKTITAPNGTTNKTYTITFVIQTVDDAFITSLRFFNDSINFSKSVSLSESQTNYTISIPASMSGKELKYEYKVKNRNNTVSGSINIPENANESVWTQMVEASDNSKTRTYTVTINIEEIIDGGFIKLNNSGVTKTVSDYKGEHSDVTKVMNKNRQDKSTDAYLATGDIILKGSSEYRIVILSDINGDGKTSSIDYVRIWNHLDRSNTNKITDELQLMASDVNQDNKVSALDYVKIWNMLKRN